MNINFSDNTNRNLVQRRAAQSRYVAGPNLSGTLDRVERANQSYQKNMDAYDAAMSKSKAIAVDRPEMHALIDQNYRQPIKAAEEGGDLFNMSNTARRYGAALARDISDPSSDFGVLSTRFDHKKEDDAKSDLAKTDPTLKKVDDLYEGFDVYGRSAAIVNEDGTTIDANIANERATFLKMGNINNALSQAAQLIKEKTFGTTTDPKEGKTASGRGYMKSTTYTKSYVTKEMAEKGLAVMKSDPAYTNDVAYETHKLQAELWNNSPSLRAQYPNPMNMPVSGKVEQQALNNVEDDYKEKLQLLVRSNYKEKIDFQWEPRKGGTKGGGNAEDALNANPITVNYDVVNKNYANAKVENEAVSEELADGMTRVSAIKELDHSVSPLRFDLRTEQGLEKSYNTLFDEDGNLQPGMQNLKLSAEDITKIKNDYTNARKANHNYRNSRKKAIHNVRMQGKEVDKEVLMYADAPKNFGIALGIGGDFDTMDDLYEGIYTRLDEIAAGTGPFSKQEHAFLQGLTGTHLAPENGYRSRSDLESLPLREQNDQINKQWNESQWTYGNIVKAIGDAILDDTRGEADFMNGMARNFPKRLGDYGGFTDAILYNIDTRIKDEMEVPVVELESTTLASTIRPQVFGVKADGTPYSQSDIATMTGTIGKTIAKQVTDANVPMQVTYSSGDNESRSMDVYSGQLSKVFDDLEPTMKAQYKGFIDNIIGADVDVSEDGYRNLSEAISKKIKNPANYEYTQTAANGKPAGLAIVRMSFTPKELEAMGIDDVDSNFTFSTKMDYASPEYDINFTGFNLVSDNYGEQWKADVETVRSETNYPTDVKLSLYDRDLGKETTIETFNTNARFDPNTGRDVVETTGSVIIAGKEVKLKPNTNPSMLEKALKGYNNTIRDEINFGNAKTNSSLDLLKQIDELSAGQSVAVTGTNGNKHVISIDTDPKTNKPTFTIVTDGKVITESGYGFSTPSSMISAYTNALNRIIGTETKNQEDNT